MYRTDAFSWVCTVCSGCFRLSQVKTLSELVVGCLNVWRVSLANIGRNLLGEVSAKHKIKRTWRFVANPRVEVSDAMRGVVAHLVKHRKKKPLLVAFDWTDIRGFGTLMAAAVRKGRAVRRSGPAGALSATPPAPPWGAFASLRSAPHCGRLRHPAAAYACSCSFISCSRSSNGVSR